MYKYDMHIQTAKTSPSGKIEAEKIIQLHKVAKDASIIIKGYCLKLFLKIIKTIVGKNERLFKVYRTVLEHVAANINSVDVF